MKQLTFAVALCLWTAPVLSQDARPLEDELRDFFGEFTTPLLPLLDDLAGQIKDLSNYHAPEILPNGDILIRKRRGGEKIPEAKPQPNKIPDENPDETIDL